MKLPLISVVVPFVNHRDFIESCCRQLDRQTYPEIEIILVDNGSSDGSLEIAENLAKGNPDKIRLVSEDRKGIPFARNRGLSEASGEYISFLDVDDRFTDNKLELLHQQLMKFPEAVLAFGQTRRIYLETQRQVIQDPGVAVPGINFPPLLALDWIRSFYHLPQTGATLIRTRTAREINGFPEKMLLGNDDAGFHLEIAAWHPVVYFPEVVVDYFRHEKSEGARLNQKESVHGRYLDAYLKSAEPLGKRYYLQTGDIRLWGFAQRSLYLNFITCQYKLKLRSLNDVDQIAWFPFYKWILLMYKFLPFGAAHFLYKVFRRPAALIKSEKYPL